MCLIAYVPAGKKLPTENIVAADRGNNDGIGIMSADGVHKFLGRKKLKKAMAYIAALEEENTEYAIHFRYATHGAVTAANCHPHQLPNGNGWLMHNGVLSDYTAKSCAIYSDTAVFVRELGDPKAIDKTKDAYLDYWSEVGDRIKGNKLVIMLPDYSFVIVNGSLGTEKDDIWYSQTYSLPSLAPRYSSWSRPYTGGYYRYGNWIPRDDDGEPRINRGGYGGFTSYADYLHKKYEETNGRRETPRGWRRTVDPATKLVTFEKVAPKEEALRDAAKERLNAALDRHGVPQADPAKPNPWLAWDRDKDGNDAVVTEEALDKALERELAGTVTNCVLCFRHDLPVDADSICEDCLRKEASELDAGALLPGWSEAKAALAGLCVDCNAKIDYVGKLYCGGEYCIGEGYKEIVR